MARKLSRRVLAEYIAQQLLADGQRTKVVRQLAAYLIDNRRTNELDLIVRDVDYYLSQHGHVNVRVTSAFDLTTNTRMAIEKLVKSQTGATSLQIEPSADPSVLGGARIDIPGRQLDQTVLHQLTTLRTAYKKS